MGRIQQYLWGCCRTASSQWRSQCPQFHVARTSFASSCSLSARLSNSASSCGSDGSSYGGAAFGTWPTQASAAQTTSAGRQVGYQEPTCEAIAWQHRYADEVGGEADTGQRWVSHAALRRQTHSPHRPAWSSSRLGCSAKTSRRSHRRRLGHHILPYWRGARCSQLDTAISHCQFHTSRPDRLWGHRMLEESLECFRLTLHPPPGQCQVSGCETDRPEVSPGCTEAFSASSLACGKPRSSIQARMFLCVSLRPCLLLLCLHNHGLVPSLSSVLVTCLGFSLSALDLGELGALWHPLSQILTSDVMSQSHEGPSRPNCAFFGCKPIAPWSLCSTLCTIDRVDVLLQVPQPHRDAGWSNCALYGCIPLLDRVSFGFRPSSAAPAFCVSIGKVPLQIPPPLWCQIGTSVALGYQPESGAEAILVKEPTSVSWPYVSWAIGLAISIAHSGALSLLLLMLAMLCKPCCPSSMGTGRLLCRYIRALPLRILCAWKVASPGDPAVTWSPPLNRKGGPVRQRANHGSNRPGTNVFFAWILVALALPEPVHAAPFLNPVWFLTPLAAQAMTRQPQPNDPPGQAYPTRRPHLIPPDELTTHVGSCPDVVVLDPLDPFEGCESRVLSCSSPRFRRGAPDEDTVAHEWLGVHLYTPHYQTLQLAVNPEEKNPTICHAAAGQL